GIVRFDDGLLLKCSQYDIQFKYADHLHYGSFGDLVTRAVHTTTKRNIAVKIIQKMETARAIQHENIVRLHGFVIEEMTCYMVMERMEASLCEAMNIIHSNHILKHEISEIENFLGSMTVDVVLAPKQILIGNDGKVKVAVSAAFPNGGVPPIRYSSPEHVESNHVNDYSKTGVWGLGIILIEAASGKYPYSGSIDFVVADQIVDPNQQPHLGGKFSLEMSDFVDACLLHSVQARKTKFYREHMQRVDRFESVKALLHRVQHYLEELRRE
ncbi:hypothetical protein PRIPAC_79235, partial [Pristionchus pacificus]|uniref:Protein kinase domain-containing protein n=1 Tax=Pristionchus pacificus TaxID=54126 RepID=A0A2A6BH58_PRIPA